MRIYIFKSETRQELRAFAGDPVGSKLPQQHGPWTAIVWSGPMLILLTSFHAYRSSGPSTATAFNFGA
jgi:hypothetical protein